MFTLNPDYALSETTAETRTPRVDHLCSEPKNRVGNFFPETTNRVEENEPVALIITIEIEVCVYDPASDVHIYLYVHANPVNGIDPSGMFRLAEIAQVAFVVGTISSIASVSVTAIFNPNATFTDYAVSAGTGFVGGAVSVVVGPFAGGFSAGFLSGAIAARRAGLGWNEATLFGVFSGLAGGAIGSGVGALTNKIAPPINSSFGLNPTTVSEALNLIGRNGILTGLGFGGLSSLYSTGAGALVDLMIEVELIEPGQRQRTIDQLTSLPGVRE